MAWAPVWALPNICLDQPIECGALALVPARDTRIQQLKRQHPNFRVFMRRFRDAFHNRIEPSIVILDIEARHFFNEFDALVSFRNLLAVSVIPISLSRMIVQFNRRSGVPHSNYFWPYPWMIDRNYELLTTITPSKGAQGPADELRGQSSPELSHVRLRRSDFDEILLSELLARWRLCFESRSPHQNDIALFRSLNMAYQAMLMPGGVDTTFLDIGRQLALWVAAFEILVHPRRNDARLPDVLDLLREVPWLDKKCSYSRFKIRISRGRTERMNLACWLFSKIYNLRNDFMHGNSVSPSVLVMSESRRRIIDFAPIIYRLGLTACLGVSWRKKLSDTNDHEEVARYVCEKMDFEQPQRTIEKALLLARVTEDEQRRRRQVEFDRARAGILA